MRMTVATCVMLLELTNNLALLPLMMLVTLVAKVSMVISLAGLLAAVSTDTADLHRCWCYGVWQMCLLLWHPPRWLCEPPTTIATGQQHHVACSPAVCLLLFHMMFLLPTLLVACFSLATMGGAFKTPCVQAVGDGTGIKPIYESLMDLKGLPFLGSHADSLAHHITAAEAAGHPAVTFARVERVGTIVEVLRSTKHNGFAVIERSMDGEQHIMGVVLRAQLAVLLRSRRCFQPTSFVSEVSGCMQMSGWGSGCGRGAALLSAGG